MCERHADTEVLTGLLAGAGLAPRGRFVPTDAVMQGDAYFDGRGPLDPAWRRGDSLWSVVSDVELEDALTRIRTLDGAGALDAFVAEQDRIRPSVGQFGFHYAVKDLAAGNDRPIGRRLSVGVVAWASASPQPDRPRPPLSGIFVTAVAGQTNGFANTLEAAQSVRNGWAEQHHCLHYLRRAPYSAGRRRSR